MTTTINIQIPAPNHQGVKITKQERLNDGTWVDLQETSSNPVTMGHNQSTTQHVYGTRRLILEEVALPTEQHSEVIESEKT